MISNGGQSPLTTSERLDLIPAYVSTMVQIMFVILGSPFRAKNTPERWQEHVQISLVRKLTERLSARQIQYVMPASEKAYVDYSNKHALTQNIVKRDSFQGFWLGDESANTVLIYLHGGGYAIPIAAEGLDWLAKVQKSMGKGLAAFMVDYTLLPEATYPAQLKQAVAACHYILEETHRDPSTVLLAGDSAGGNLALSLLSHISHPKVDVPELKISTPFLGLYLMSPWTSFRTWFPSMKQNILKCMVTPKLATQWSDGYKGAKPSDFYNEPLMAPTSWWEGTMVRNTLVTNGEDDILRDQIQEWVEKYEVANPNTKLITCDGEGHCAPLYRGGVPAGEDSKASKAFKEWLHAIL